MLKIKVTKNPNRIWVSYLDQVSMANWNSKSELSMIVGDELLLEAVLMAWSGHDGEWEVSISDLEEAIGRIHELEENPDITKMN
jgi:hypothetical protein